MCGEAIQTSRAADPIAGPSPRVRGSRARRRGPHTRSGSIPACAGKPRRQTLRGETARVHPRVCGEAAPVNGSPYAKAGPSPRVRGSPVRRRACGTQVGSIPACAGKPGHHGQRRNALRVHPRVCGEAPPRAGQRHRRRGPSPRVRGSPGTRLRPTPSRGSIPACAGKPNNPLLMEWLPRVHPRVCGGSRRDVVAGAREQGSIPACAGKPCPGRPASQGCRVHPRVCGEARFVVGDLAFETGPSPRVRGSLAKYPLGVPKCGSIPACAGKPLSDY